MNYVALITRIYTSLLRIFCYTVVIQNDAMYICVSLLIPMLQIITSNPAIESCYCYPPCFY